MDPSIPVYEIRTYKNRHHASLTMIAECPNDIVAIVMARKFIRKGEGVEVWRDDSILYRLEPRKIKTASRRHDRSFFHLEKWLQTLKSALPAPARRGPFRQASSL